MLPRLQRSLTWLRVACVVYGLAWVATPTMFLIAVIADPSLALFGKRVDLGAAASPIIVFSFLLVAWASPAFVWALGRARHEAGGSGFSPVLLALTALALPYIPLGVFIIRSSESLISVDARAGEPVPWFLAWAGPLIFVPVGVAMAAIATPERDVGFYIFSIAVVLYGMTRIVIARHVHRICSNLLLRPAVDDMRASHVAPVGGG